MKYIFVLAASLISLMPIPSWAVNTCGGQTSTGNPLPCCDTGGNCTWWAWKMAKEANWPAIPTGNANTWDDTAKANKNLYNTSTVPTVGAIAVKESSPYTCSINGKSVKNGCDTGHVVYITGIVKDKKGNITDVTTSEMSCGSYGMYTKTRAATWFDTYITPKDLSGQTAAAAGCTDGSVVGTISDKLGNKVNLYWSNSCKTNWSQVVPKVNTSLVSATIKRTSDSKSYSSNGFGTTVSAMVSGTSQSCASGLVGAIAVGSICK
jgi:surface antigen